MKLKYLGQVATQQVPMLMTFEESDVEFICEHLGAELDRAYKIIDFFDFSTGEDPWEEE